MAGITGTTGNDYLVGTPAPDTIAGLAGDDQINGRDNNDTLDGGDGDDLIFGGSHRDVLRGGNGDDTLYGDSGADVLHGGAGNDVLDGGSSDYDVDVASYAESTAGVRVSLALQGVAQDTGGAGFDRLANIEQLTGSNFDDVLISGAEDGRLTGGAGDDQLLGNDGNDFLMAGPGNDIVDGGAGMDRVSFSDATAGVSVDLRIQGVAQNTGGGGSDTLISIEFVNGSNFDDSLSGADDDDQLFGLRGNDIIEGGAGDDQIGGGDGNDTLNGGAGSDWAIFDATTSAIIVNLALGTATGQGADTLTGIENVSGSLGNDIIIGDDGNNIIAGDEGNDTLDGGAGSDTVSYANTIGANVVVNLATGFGQENLQDGGVFQDSLTNFENVIGSSLSDSVVGDVKANRLSGGEGDDTIAGAAGDDLLDGGAGADVLDGGEGIDTASYAAATSGVTVSLALDNLQQDTVGAGLDTLDQIENLEGSAQADTLTGDEGANLLAGLLGDDTLIGGAGNDSISGGDGADRMVLSGNFADYTIVVDGEAFILTDTRAGGDGVDTATGIEVFQFADGDIAAAALAIKPIELRDDELVIVRGVASALKASTLLGNDTVNYNNTVGSVSNAQGATVTLIDGRLVILATGETASFDYTVIGEEGPQTAHVVVRTVLAGTAADTLTPGVTATGADLQGLAGNDVLHGTVGQDRLVGGAGNDILYGGAGDELIGGAGNDVYRLSGTLGTVILEQAGEGTDSVEADGDYALSENVENLVLTGTGNWSGTGNAMANKVTGNSGDNLIDGGAGADTLNGGAGNDTYVIDDLADRVIDVAGIDEVRTALATYTLASVVENLTYTGPGNFHGIGNAAANVLIGGDGDDVLDGKGGSDRLIGGSGADAYYVDRSTDVIVETGDEEDIDTVYAAVTYALGVGVAVEVMQATGTAAVKLTGNERDQTLFGNAANNILDGGSGLDILAGGLGDDTYYVHDQDEDAGEYAVIVELDGGGYDTVMVASYYSMADYVERAVLTATGLSVYGNDQNNVLVGNALANTLNGAGGADLMQGGGGNDLYMVDNVGDVVQDSSGIDTVEITIGDYTLATGLENLRVAVFVGDIQTRVLTGNTLANTITGGGGSDTIYGLTGNDVLIGDFRWEGAWGDDTLDGGDGNDRLDGRRGADTLIGGAGDDYLDGGMNDDILNGGAGNDTYVIDSLQDVIVDSGGYDTVRSASVSNYTMAEGIERFVRTIPFDATIFGNSAANEIAIENAAGYGSGIFFGMGGNDRLIGMNGSDWFYGGEGDDTLIGGGNGDYLDGGDGNDKLYVTGPNEGTLVGGAGNDSFYLDLAFYTIIEEIGGGIDTVYAPSGTGVSVTLADNVERLTVTGSASFTGIGNGGNNTLRGAAGNDALMGMAGSDLIYGEAGDDELWGDDGNDVLDGGDGVDLLHGGAGNDRLLAGGNPEEGDAYDELRGGTGNDTYLVENYYTLPVELAGEGIDTVETTLSSYGTHDNVENLTFVGTGSFIGQGNALANTIRGNVGRDILRGDEGNDTLYGNGGPDMLIGGADNDVLIGGDGDDFLQGDAGDDRLTAGAGDDSLFGNAGADVFIFTAVSDSTGQDVIWDFDTADTIDLAKIDANTGAAGDQAFAFIGMAAFTGVAGQLRNSYDGRFTHLLADVDGDGQADFELLLSGNVALTVSDFYL